MNRIQIESYFATRVKQMGKGYTLFATLPIKNAEHIEWGIKAVIKDPIGNEYQSVYVYDEFQNKGMMTEYIKLAHRPFITANECGIEAWFKKNKVPYLMVPLSE